MSIAIIGQEKYAFQDLVCIETMLRFFTHDEATLFIEPEGGEDAELTLNLDGHETTLEIQVKGARGAVTQAEIAACLAHAPPHKAEPTLFDRVLNDTHRQAVLVMSGRADDACARYLGSCNWHGEAHDTSKLTHEHAGQLLAAYAAANVGGKPDGPLATRRRERNKERAAALDYHDVFPTLSRLIVFDQVDDTRLQACCSEHLRRDHRVPSDRIEAVLQELHSAVVEAKKSKLDAFPLVRSIISKASPSSIEPEGYVPRGLEHELFDALSRDNVLLLSGMPRVGKSYTARSVAEQFMGSGYDVREFVDVKAADRFLRDPGTALRLALLDDPLGGSQVSSDAARALANLTALIPRTTPQRKLLVAQGLGPLLSVTRRRSLDEVVTAKRRWRDLGDIEGKFLSRVWQSQTSAAKVEGAVCDRVTEALQEGALVLEPGCLEHLVANLDRLSVAASNEEIERIAREDAKQLGDGLAADGLDSLAISLALSTAAYEPIHLTELAFVRGSGGDVLPGKKSGFGRIISLGDPSPSKRVDPAYEHPPEVAEADSAGLETLERRHFIEFDDLDATNFTHAFYRAAAESLVDTPTLITAQKIEQMLERGLFCRSPRTSRATARNLDWVFKQLKQRTVQRSAIVQHAIDGLGSVYPATRDLCFRFLLNHLDALPEEQQQDLSRWISRVTSVSLKDLEWSDGEARLPVGGKSGVDYVDFFCQSVSKQDVAAEIALLDAPEGAASPEQAARALRYLATDPGAMTPTMAGRLLSYDEAVLRAEATRLWLSRSRTEDDIVLDRIFTDRHPSCALGLLKGAIAGWEAASSERRTRLLDGLAAVAADRAAAAAMLNHLVVFDRVEKTGKNPPWSIFEALMPVVMMALPDNAVFNDARLFHVASTAVDEISTTSMLAFCDGWIDWLERSERTGRLPSDFSLGVADIVIMATTSEPVSRDDRIERLLSFNGTGARVRFMADLIDHWKALRIDEQEAVLAHLLRDAPDTRWMQAVALTRSTVPSTITDALLPKGTSLNHPADQLIDILPPALLNAAIHVYAGRPQPLWWLGTHHSGEAIWEPVMEAVARRPDHSQWELAQEHCAFTGDGERVALIVTDLGAENAERMLEILLRLKVGCTGNFMPQAWAAVLRQGGADEYRCWLDRMFEASPAILDDVSEIKEWLCEERDQNELADRLENDLTLLKLANSAFAVADTELQEEAIKILTFLCKERPPVIFGTCDRLIAKIIRIAGDTNDLTELLQKRRQEILDERDKIEKTFERSDLLPDGWIAP
ncbi:hypothetical protein [Oceanicaulis sp. UBA2681]|uniref:nSTAND3 domain-containing NTPase n=1 Tax=Oceanicaulis sp. UBA2681 TaxID=1947007 RepID=UPI00257B48A8|nr:hypothetical protein [Oceanicaulis sp. UBA2681]|tara:strand:- start:4480 stop:8298 length:3819 start_codon:yes stop_codon:yes gene_type:complete